MLFNSQEFLFAFLPLTLLATAFALRWRGRDGGVLTLTSASLFFYGWWHVYGLLLIGVSIAFSYTLAQAIAKTGRPRETVPHDTAKRRSNCAMMFR